MRGFNQADQERPKAGKLEYKAIRGKNEQGLTAVAVSKKKSFLACFELILRLAECVELLRNLNSNAASQYVFINSSEFKQTNSMQKVGTYLVNRLFWTELHRFWKKINLISRRPNECEPFHNVCKNMHADCTVIIIRGCFCFFFFLNVEIE